MTRWDHVVAVSRFPGPADLKRSLRKTAELKAPGAAPGKVGAEEDWRRGHRRQHTP